MQQLWADAFRRYWLDQPFANSDNGQGGGGSGGGSNGTGAGTGAGNEGDSGENGNGDGEGDDGDGEQGGEFKPPATQDELNKLIQDRLARDRKKRDADLKAQWEKERKDAAEKEKAVKDGDLAKQLEIANKRIADLEGEVAVKSLATIKADVAAKLKLPADAAKYLTGDDEASVMESGKELRKLIGTVKEAPKTEGGTGGGGTNTKTGNPNGQEQQNRTTDTKESLTRDGKKKVEWPS